MQKRADDKLIVGIVGGSVAYWLSALGDAALVEELKRSPQYKDKEIVIVRMALGGYMQPQQLVTLNYILSLGGEFDILINLDGFNEVALPEIENVRHGIFPFFPRQWGFLAKSVPDVEFQRLVGKVVFLKDLRIESAQYIVDSTLRRSVTAQMIWKVLDRVLLKRVAKASAPIQRYKSDSSTFQVTGPGIEGFTDENLYKELAAVWQRSSIQLNLMCKSNDIQYFHFLQPNQYVEGSKPIGEEEALIAIRENHDYKVGVEKGYPELVAAAEGLRAAQVPFYDLRMLFSDVSEPLYIDDCCHLNELGNDILGRRIARDILHAANQ